MAYCIPLLLDQNREIEGLFVAHTTGGPVLLIAKPGVRFEKFLAVASRATQSEGKLVGHIELPVSTFHEAVKEVLTMDPSLVDSVIIIDEGDPYLDVILEHFGTS